MSLSGSSLAIVDVGLNISASKDQVAARTQSRKSCMNSARTSSASAFWRVAQFLDYDSCMAGHQAKSFLAEPEAAATDGNLYTQLILCDDPLIPSQGTFLSMETFAAVPGQPDRDLRIWDVQTQRAAAE
jgi:hypothetical protein